MKILYAARVGRFDLLRPVCWLATKVTKWSKTCDRALHKLVSYINSSLDVSCYGWIGDPIENLELVIYADANWAEKPTFVSTSGCFLCLSGKNTFFPLAALSKKQTAKSHSTPEAEIVSADVAVRTIGLPALQLWDLVLGDGKRKLSAIFKEDNETAIRVMGTGKNPTMRHMQRTHGLCLARLHEQFSRGEFILDKCPTRQMSADIFTKAILERLKWIHARKLIAHYLPTELGIGVAKAKGTISPAVFKQGGTATGKHNRIIIEYCCGPNSKIGQQHLWSKDCLVIRVTEQTDATKVTVIDSLIQLVRSTPKHIPILLFSAMPCTGGSPWQNINFRKPSGPRLMLKHKLLFNKLWTGFQRLTDEVYKKLGHICMEWPKGCKYWSVTKVIALLHRYNFVHAIFDGCMFDLKSIVYPDKHIKKPWRISTTSKHICAAFDNKCCDHSHEHVPCAGRDTKVTEEYTLPLVKCLHDSWRKHANQITRSINTSVHANNKPRINFFVSNLKTLASTAPLHSQHPALSMASSSITKGQGKSAAKASTTAGKEATANKPLVFEDVKLAFSITESEKKS